MSNPGAEALQSLINYSNEITGESDTTLSDAVESLVSGYGGGSGVTVDDIATGYEKFGGDVTINATYIRAYAFARFYDLHDSFRMNEVSSITSLNAPNCVTVGSYAFYNNMNLISVNLPECETIEANAFYGSTAIRYMQIKNLYIPKVVNIGNSAFEFIINGFDKLVLPESLETLGTRVFANNRNLKTVYFMGNNITSISSNCFYGNNQILTDIYVPWSEGAVANAPWGAGGATIHYNTVYDSNGEPII